MSPIVIPSGEKRSRRNHRSSLGHKNNNNPHPRVPVQLRKNLIMMNMKTMTGYCVISLRLKTVKLTTTQVQSGELTLESEGLLNQEKKQSVTIRRLYIPCHQKIVY